MHISDARFIELLQQGIEKLLESQSELITAVNDATMHLITPNEPPSVAKTLEQSNMHSILHVLSQITRSPGAVPEPTISENVIKLMRSRVPDGTAALTIKCYRAGQVAAWHVWMKVAFQLSDDPKEVLGLLDRSYALLNCHIEQTIDLANDYIERFQIELVSNTPTSHRGLITAILEGQEIDPISASHRLAYPLTGTHQALVIWSDHLSSEQSQFDAFLTAFTQQPQIGTLVSLNEKPDNLWIWFSGTCPPNLEELLLQYNLRATLGTKQTGLHGFATSHHQAAATQNIAKPSASQPRLLSYDETRLSIVMLGDKDAFNTLTAEILGNFLYADPIYHETLKSYLSHGCNLVRTADTLNIHRNTLQKRLDRANDLLPEPLSTRNRLQIGAILDCLENR